MSGLELNKLAASVFLAGLIAMVVANVTDVLYKPNLKPQTRGFKLEVHEVDNTPQSTVAEVTFDIPALMAKADAAKGEATAKVCQMCHNFGKGQGVKIGPDLWDVVGNDKISSPDFDYSAAFKGKGGKWEYEDLFHFLNSPQKFIPGTKMTFAGLKKPTDIANVIAYLRSLSDAPKDLPK